MPATSAAARRRSVWVTCNGPTIGRGVTVGLASPVELAADEVVDRVAAGLARVAAGGVMRVDRAVVDGDAGAAAADDDEEVDDDPAADGGCSEGV